MPTASKGESFAALHTRVLSTMKVNDRFLRLQEQLSKYPLIQWATWDVLESLLIAFGAGRKSIESWAAHALFNMAQAERLDRLRTCFRKGCNQFFVAQRFDGKFCGDICRIKYHQSDPEFKAERSKRAAAAYLENKRRLQRQEELHGKA